MILPSTVIFDLDGTLLDTSDGILLSLEHTLRVSSVPLTLPLSSDLIGPSLSTLLSRYQADSLYSLDKMLQIFTEHYDVFGYKSTSLFIGIKPFLHRLQKLGISLFIVTNKRKIPTYLLLNMFSLTPIFTATYSPDMVHSACMSKVELFQRIQFEYGLSFDNCIYMGDRQTDYLASSSVGLPFVLAEWGYGSSDIVRHYPSMVSPQLESLSDAYMSHLQ